MILNPVISTSSQFASVNPSIKKGQFTKESDTGFFKFAESQDAYNNIPYLPIPSRKVLAADQVVTASTSIVKVTGLELPLDVSGKYIVKLVIFFTSVVAAGFKYRHRGPSTPTKISFEKNEILPGASAYNSVKSERAYSSGDENLSVGSTDEGKIQIEGYIENGSTAGDLEFAFAQVTSNAGNTVVKAGSYAEYTRIL